jgi:nitroreductase/FMN reductase [NAD(P)H]
MPISKLLSALQARFGAIEGLQDNNSKTLLQIAARGSCRSFTPEPVPLDLVNTLCAVALSSPSKSDLQQRDIVMVDDPEQRGKINALFPRDSLINGAPLLLVFCGNNRRQRQISEWRKREFANDHLDAFFNASVDAAIALDAFIIAAESIGLGCCPISAIRNQAYAVSELIALPDYVFPIAGLALGWPAQTPPVSMRLPLSCTVHRNRFSDDNVQDQITDYDKRRAREQPFDAQRQPDRFGDVPNYGWSEDKARQYAREQRADFGEYIKSRKFNLK